MDWQLVEGNEVPGDGEKTARVVDFNQTFSAPRANETIEEAAADYAAFSDNDDTRSVRLGFCVGTQLEREVFVSMPGGTIEQAGGDP